VTAVSVYAFPTKPKNLILCSFLHTFPHPKKPVEAVFASTGFGSCFNVVFTIIGNSKLPRDAVKCLFFLCPFFISFEDGHCVSRKCLFPRKRAKFLVPLLIILIYGTVVSFFYYLRFNWNFLVAYSLMAGLPCPWNARSLWQLF